jgi:hypothetical protein
VASPTTPAPSSRIRTKSSTAAIAMITGKIPLCQGFLIIAAIKYFRLSKEIPRRNLHK